MQAAPSVQMGSMAQLAWDCWHEPERDEHVVGRRSKPAKFESEPVADTVRRCAVTRARKDRSDLIRFVADPMGRVVPDLALKLPGRGVWVSANRQAVCDAIQKKAFAAGLKQKVETSEDLVDQIEGLLTKRLAGALSLANKAGLALTGFEKVSNAISAESVVALIHASDAAADGRQKLDRKYAAVAKSCQKPINIIDCLTVSQLSLAIGRSNVVHAALGKGSVADRFLRDAERLDYYRSGEDKSLTACEEAAAT